MTRVALSLREARDDVVVLAGRAVFPSGPATLTYRTRTGALLRVDDRIAGAFDRRHDAIVVEADPGERELVLEVERRSLPTDGLPDRDGVRWKLLQARAAQQPARALTLQPGAPPEPHADPETGVPLVGHAHLDIAWLWTYDDARRKAARTFATALRQINRDPRYVFAQSQPQLYAWVERDHPELFARIRDRVGRGWDASVAALWVESDMHAPSGESILRQFAHAAAYCERALGMRPTVAWLPDTFGFPSTLAQLAAHAGVPYFATTKLQWNDTTRWPYPQFRWEGDDGSSVLAAVIDRYDGPPSRDRYATARARQEVLVHGWGDGGGGPSDAELAARLDTRPWTAVGDWFAGLDAAAVPAHRGELYLETHRGTYTTHHALKARMAALERRLAAAEEAAAWVVAVRAPATIRRALADDLRAAWEPLLRAQFHDVAAGTSIPAAYARVDADLARAEHVVERIVESATSVLPKASVETQIPPAVVPVAMDDGTWTVRNAFVRARVRADGTVVELATADGANLIGIANGLALYRDRPKAWDAWNLDRSYLRKPLRVRPAGGGVEDDAIVARLRVGKASAATMRVALHEGEPWLRVTCAVAWREDHAVLRVEHRVAVDTDAVRFGQPHGTLVRAARMRTAAERARFEVPAQRYAHVTEGERGLAVFAPDLYGWSAVALGGGGVRLGTSLLRAPRWPDPGADRGEHALQWALVPTAGAPVSGLETAYAAYAEIDRVRLFDVDDPAVAIVATYPTDDAEGVIVRVRECDGATRPLALRCGGRARRAIPVDGANRPLAGEVTIEGEAIVDVLPPYALRSYRIDFA